MKRYPYIWKDIPGIWISRLSLGCHGPWITMAQWSIPCPNISCSSKCCQLYKMQPESAKIHPEWCARANSSTRGNGSHEGKRDSQRKQSESTSTLTRGVSQWREYKVRVQYWLAYARIRFNRESCTGCRRIRSMIASRGCNSGITRICTVTEFTNRYWMWANRTENLPFESVGLLWII